jgi:PAS domain-containing protein
MGSRNEEQEGKHRIESWDDFRELHPAVLHGIRAYVEDGDVDGARIVARILTTLNEYLLRADVERSRRAAECEARLRVLTERMPAIHWTTDRHLRVTSTTGGGLAKVGARPRSTGARPLTEILGTDDPESPPLRAHYRALLGGAAVYEHEWRARIFRVHVEPLRGPEGRIAGVVGAALDITESRRAEDHRMAARERKARLNTMLFAARELAERLDGDLMASAAAVRRLRPQPALGPELREAVDAAASGLSRAMGDIAELRRLIRAQSPEHLGDLPPDGASGLAP